MDSFHQIHGLNEFHSMGPPREVAEFLAKHSISRCISVCSVDVSVCSVNANHKPSELNSGFERNSGFSVGFKASVRILPMPAILAVTLLRNVPLTPSNQLNSPSLLSASGRVNHRVIISFCCFALNCFLFLETGTAGCAKSFSLSLPQHLTTPWHSPHGWRCLDHLLVN